MTKTNVSKMNKKGLAFAAVVLLLAAAIFVGAAAGATEIATAEQFKNALTSSNGGEYILTASFTSQGISVCGKDAPLIIDFNEKTVTFNKPGAGSAGTKTQGLQLLKGGDSSEYSITFKNGTINIASENKEVTWTSDATEKGIAMLIQDYAPLTLEDMTIDGSNIAHNGSNIRYVVSTNYGDVNITGSTSITAPDGDFAFDVYDNTSTSYPGSPTVTVETTGDIVGNIKYATTESDKLIIKKGSFTDITNAVKYATSGATIKLADDVTLKQRLLIDKPITFDGNGKTITAASDFSFKGGNPEKEDENLYGHLVQIDASTWGSGFTNPVTLTNVTLDGNHSATSQGASTLMICNSTGDHQTVNHILEDVTIKNSKKESLRVAGAKVTIENLTTSGSAWGTGIDAQGGADSNPWSTHSIITIDTLKQISDPVQIKDDGAVDEKYKTSLAEVTVTDDGVTKYRLVELKEIGKDSSDYHAKETCNAWLNADTVKTIGAIEVTPSDNTKPVRLYAVNISNVLFVAINGDKDKNGNVTIAGAADGDTIKLLNDLPNCPGISVPSGKNFTLDFNEKSVTFTTNPAGSTETKNQCFQLLKNSTITMKNGTIVADNTGSNTFKLLIQNYANLTLTDMILDGATKGTDGVQYVFSSNNGKVTINGNTSIKAPSGQTALDVCWWPYYETESKVTYPDGTQVTVNTTGEIDGIVEFSWTNKSGRYMMKTPIMSSLTINNGNFKSDVRLMTDTESPSYTQTDLSGKLTISGGRFSTDPSAYVVSGYHAEPISEGAYKYEVVQDAPPAQTYTVTFDADNGDDPTSVTVEEGNTVAKPADPKKEEGYGFDGWLKDGEKYDFATPVTEDITLIAKWVVVVPPEATEKQIEEVVKAIEETGEVITVKVDATDDESKAAVEKLVDQAQKKGVASQVQLDVDAGSAAVIKEVITDKGSAENPVFISVTGDNKEAVSGILNALEGEDKIKAVQLPVKEDGTNINVILDISKTHEEAEVFVPEVIVVSKETTMEMTGVKFVTLEDIAKGVTAGDSAEKLVLDLELNKLNVQNAVSILGNISTEIQIDREPLDKATITTTPGTMTKFDLEPEEHAEISAVSIVKMDGVKAAATSKEKDKTIEGDVTILGITDTTGYTDQKTHSVFQIVVPENTGSVDVTLNIFKADAISGQNFYLRHYTVGKGWDADFIAPIKVEKKDDGSWDCTYKISKFSPFALVSGTPVPKSSGSSSSGASVWATPTPTPGTPATEPTTGQTPGAADVPGVKPIETPTGSSAKTPAPFLGILAGLGAAAAVFGLRRK